MSLTKEKESYLVFKPDTDIKIQAKLITTDNYITDDYELTSDIIVNDILVHHNTKHQTIIQIVGTSDCFFRFVELKPILVGQMSSKDDNTRFFVYNRLDVCREDKSLKSYRLKKGEYKRLKRSVDIIMSTK